jgi:hypothetical protein
MYLDFHTSCRVCFAAGHLDNIAIFDTRHKVTAMLRQTFS